MEGREHRRRREDSRRDDEGGTVGEACEKAEDEAEAMEEGRWAAEDVGGGEGHAEAD